MASQTDKGRPFRHFPLAGTKEAIARRLPGVKKGRVVITPDVVSTLLRFCRGGFPNRFSCTAAAGSADFISRWLSVPGPGHR